jgi:hypothetical protein
MAFDPTVISSIADYAPKPVDAIAKGVSIKDMMDQEQLNRLQVQGRQKESREQSQVEEILKSSDYSTPEGLAATAAKVNRVSPKSAMDLMKTGQAYQSGQIQNEIDQLSLADKRQELIVSAIDPIVARGREMKTAGASDLEVKAFITQQMPQALQSLRSMRMADGRPALPDDQLQMATNVPGGYTLATLEGWESRSKAGQAAIKQRLEQMKADTAERRANAADTANTERERHDRALEEAAAKKATGATFSSEERTLLSEMALRNVNLPAGLRSQQQIKATLQGLLEKNPDRSPSEIADDIKSGRLKLAAETKGAQTAGTQIGKVALAANELDTFGDQTLEASDAIPRGKFVPWTQLQQYADTKLSEPSLLRFKAKMQALENAYNQLAARSGTDVEKRAHIHELFNTANSPAAVKTLIQALKEESVGAREAANRTIAETSETSIPGAGGKGAQTSPKTASGDTGAAAARSPPPDAASGSSGAALKPGSKYQHSSGATIEILEDGS